MTQIKKYLVWIFAITLLASCSQQRKAERIVERFLDENLVNSDYRVGFGNMGTTNRIDDAQLTRMWKHTRDNDKLFKPNPTYGAYKDLKELHFLKTTIIQGKDTFIRTIYLHPEHRKDGVMDVKEN